MTESVDPITMVAFYIKEGVRGASFWSSKVCEGGSHVKHMHVDALLVDPNFSSKLMITWLNLFENFWFAFKLIVNSLLIQFKLMQERPVSFRKDYQ